MVVAKKYITAREPDCLSFIASGQSAKAAAQLGISEKAIAFYINNIKQCLHIKKTTT